MNKLNEQYIYTVAQRMSLIKSENYSKVSDIWNKYFQDENKTGAPQLLIKTAAEAQKGNLTAADWEAFFLKSGERRLKELADGQKNEYQINKSTGRTMKDITNLAKELFEKVREIGGVNLGKIAAMNVVYCKLIDEPYIMYMMQCKAIEKLKQEHPSRTYKVADAVLCEEYGIDIIEYDGDDINKAYQVITKKTTEEKKAIFIQQHTMFHANFGTEVEFLFV